MRRANLFRLAVCLGLSTLAPAGAQTFHEVFGRSHQFGELTSVSATRGPGAIASGSFIDGLPQGVLLKILSTGKLDWTRAYGPTQISAVRETLSFPGNARLSSIFPALDGGILGVGQAWAPGFGGKIIAGPLTVKLKAGGDLVWALRHRVINADLKSDQWLADLDRDPRSTWPESVVTGTVIEFCADIPSRPCGSEKPAIKSAAFVATPVSTAS